MKNINKKRTSKLLIVLNMLMLFALIAVPTYAFFWNQITETRDVNVGIGALAENLVVATKGPLDPNKKLIPSTAKFSDLDTETKELVYTFTVSLDIDEKLNANDLNVSVTSVTSVTGLEGFLTPTMSIEQAGNDVIVTIKFTIKLTKEQWTNEHNNATHTVTVTFSLDSTD